MADLESSSADNPWPAFADLLAASTLLFLILFAVVAIPALRKGRTGEAWEKTIIGIQATLTLTFDSTKVNISRVGDYVLVRIPENATFPSGQSALQHLKSDGKELLRQFGQYIGSPAILIKIDQIQVVGHTSPEGSAELNWNLSAARAATVARFLIDSVGVDPCKISALGRSKYYPVAPETARANNSMVDAADRRIELEIHPTIPDDNEQLRRAKSCVNSR